MSRATAALHFGIRGSLVGVEVPNAAVTSRQHLHFVLPVRSLTTSSHPRLPDGEALGVRHGKEGGRRVRRIPLELQKLFARMMASDQAAVKLDALTASFGWERQDEVVQQDVQELNRVLFTAIDQSLNGTPASGLISDLYQGVMTNLIQCLGCGTTKEREEDYRDISLSVVGLADLAAG